MAIMNVDRPIIVGTLEQVQAVLAALAASGTMNIIRPRIVVLSESVSAQAVGAIVHGRGDPNA